MEVRSPVMQKQLLSPVECEKLIRTLDFRHNMSAMVREAESGLVNYTIDPTRRITLRGSTNDWGLVHSVLQRACNLVDEWYGCKIERWEGPYFYLYPPGGHFALHSDSHYVDTNGEIVTFGDRDYAVVIYLSEDYEGGEFVIPDWYVRTKPPAGTLLTFPADNRFRHGVEPVTSGHRIQIVTWFTDANAKRSYIPGVHGPKHDGFYRDGRPY